MSFPLLDLADHAMADTSLGAWAHISETLQEREVTTFLLVCDYLRETGKTDVTGGELADWSKVPVTSLRPRLTGLRRKGWLHSGSTRASTAIERPCHPYWPAVPRAAIERLIRDCRAKAATDRECDAREPAASLQL